MERRIGIFDSGIGGLTVARHLIPLFGGMEVLYVGDTARVPYGSRSPETIRRYARQMTLYLLEQGVEAIVVACNTISAVAADVVRECAAGIPVVDVLEPTVAVALQRTAGCVGIIGTRATITSGVYERLLHQRARQPLRTYGQPCPLFVPLVEEGWNTHPVALQVAEHYLAPLRALGIDTLILGCTHYPLLLPVFRQLLPKCHFVESGEAVCEYLRQLGYSPGANGKEARLYIHLTDAPGDVLEHILHQLQLAVAEVRQVLLPEYV